MSFLVLVLVQDTLEHVVLSGGEPDPEADLVQHCLMSPIFCSLLAKYRNDRAGLEKQRPKTMDAKLDQLINADAYLSTTGVAGRSAYWLASMSGTHACLVRWQPDSSG